MLPSAAVFAQAFSKKPYRYLSHYPESAIQSALYLLFYMPMNVIKYLQAQGIGSRKQCQELVKQQRLCLNGASLADPNAEIDAGRTHHLTLDGQALPTLPLPFWYLRLHKPAHYETSHKPRHYPAVFSLLPRHWQTLPMQAVGRLDEDTTGILIITNDGQFNHRMTSPKYKAEKLYRVSLKHPATSDLCEHLCRGVLLHDDNETVAAVAAQLQEDTTLLLTLSEGKYHQVKRMVAAAGNRVEGLHRERFAQWDVQDLAPGEWALFEP